MKKAVIVSCLMLISVICATGCASTGTGAVAGKGTTVCGGVSCIAAGATCADGTCTCATTGTTPCGAACNNLSNDSSNCGKCGVVCPTGQTCIDGTCTIPCPAGQILCGGVCVIQDINNCGTCGTVCTGVNPGCCGGICADRIHNKQHCGTCEISCPFFCNDNTCSPTCPFTVCGDNCTDTTIDPNNCGGCDIVCASGSCTGGVCDPVLAANKKNEEKKTCSSCKSAAENEVSSDAHAGLTLLHPIAHAVVLQQSLSDETTLTENERRVAVLWDQMSNLDADQTLVRDVLDALSPSELPAALDEIAGEQYTYLMSFNMYSDRRFSRTIYDSVRNLLLPCADERECAWQGWLTAEGGRAFSNGDSNAEGFKSWHYDISAGAHTFIIPSVLFGLAANYDEDFVDYDQGGHSTIHTGHGAFYGAYQTQCYYAFADLVVGYSESNFRRPIVFGSIDRRAHSKPRGVHLRGYGEAGLNLNVCNTVLQPYLGFDGGYYHVNNFKEKGADSLNLNNHWKFAGNYSLFLGSHLTSQVFSCLNVSVDAAWQHRFEHFLPIKGLFIKFGDEKQGAIIDGCQPGRDGFLGAVNVSKSINDCFEVYGEFSGEVWKHWTDFDFTVGVSAWW